MSAATDPRRLVMVVDDAADIRLLVELVLSMAGYEVVGAACGTEALELLLRGRRPDIVMLDVQMPGIDGWETLRRLRRGAATAELPVVLCTVKGLREDTLKGWSLGCDGYVGKPFDIGNLVAELEAVLGRSVKQREDYRRERIADLAGAAR